MMKRSWIFLSTFLLATMAFAEDGGSSDNGLRIIGFAIAIGLAALGGTTGQAKAAAAAFEGICKNPSASAKVFTPFILGLAFIESLVILAWLIMFLAE